MSGPESELTLEEALMGAAEAPPLERIEFRDPIARHGAAAVAAVEPWLKEPALATFAVLTIARAAAFGAHNEALAALRSALRWPISPVLAGDLQAVIERLGGSARPRPSGRATPRASRPGRAEPIVNLVIGRTYRRRELHASGWGGNWQAGISYPAKGEHVLLFSDPSKATEHGYRDRWENGQYHYYGEWHGTGDMALAGGNQAILDRSPQLHLFITTQGGHRYEGRFECIRHEPERTTRDGREFRAIVFVLRRVGDV